jgi:hypothetical protein
MEMKRRQAGASRQRIESERLVEVAGDVLHHSLHHPHVKGSRLGFHGGNVFPSRSAALDAAC